VALGRVSSCFCWRLVTEVGVVCRALCVPVSGLRRVKGFVSQFGCYVMEQQHFLCSVPGAANSALILCCGKVLSEEHQGGRSSCRS